MIVAKTTSELREKLLAFEWKVLWKKKCFSLIKSLTCCWQWIFMSLLNKLYLLINNIGSLNSFYQNYPTTLRIQERKEEIRVWQSGQTPHLPPICPKLTIPIASLFATTAAPVIPRQTPWPVDIQVHKVLSVISPSIKSGNLDWLSAFVSVVDRKYCKASSKALTWSFVCPKPAITTLTPPEMKLEPRAMGATCAEKTKLPSTCKRETSFSYVLNPSCCEK